MTQYQIAKQLKVSEQAVSKWYTGKSLPSQVNLLALAALLGEDPEELLTFFMRRKYFILRKQKRAAATKR